MQYKRLLLGKCDAELLLLEEAEELLPPQAPPETTSGLITRMFGRTSGVTAGGHTPLHTSSTTFRRAADSEIKGCTLWRWSDGDDGMWAAAEIVADDAAYMLHICWQ